jgi:O-antigen/teichoic acid export membrane protein
MRGRVAEGDAVPPPPVPSRRRGAVVMLAGGYLGLALTVVQGLVMVPLYLRYIGAGTYGAWLATGDLLGWLALLNMGIGGVVTQRMAAAHGRGERAVLGEYYGTGMLVQALLVAVLAALAAGAAPFVPGWLGIHGAEARTLARCFALAGAATGLGILATVAGTLPLAVQRMAFNAAATVACTLAGIGVTLWMLLAGHGLWALAWGMLARNASLLLALTLYALAVMQAEGTRMRVRAPVLRDLGSLAGSTVLTMLGNTAATRSDALLVAVVFRPELATVYVLTRRAAEIVSMFLALVGGAVYPGFAHLVGSGQLARARQVLAQVDRGYLAVGALAVGLYVALNRTFIELWVGPAQYGGHLLTVLVGLNVLLVGRAALLTYLLGGSGQIRQSAHVIFTEAMARVIAGLVLLFAIGIPGMPLAGILTTAVSSLVALAWLARRLEGGAPSPHPLAAWAGYALLLAGAAWIGGGRLAGSWAGFAGWAAALGLAGAGLLAALDPAARAFAAGGLRVLRPGAAARGGEAVG